MILSTPPTENFFLFFGAALAFFAGGSARAKDAPPLAVASAPATPGGMETAEWPLDQPSPPK